MPRDRVLEFLQERTPRRALAVGIFLVLLVVFWHLLPLLVFFVSFERSLGWGAQLLTRHTKMKEKPAILLQVGVFVAAVGLGVWAGVARTIRSVARVHDFPARIAALREHPLVQKVQEHLGDTEAMVERAKHYAAHGLHAASALGHLALYAFIGLILAVIYRLEAEEIDRFEASMDPRSLAGTLARWLGHLADAVVVTVQLQLIVAACNAVMTLPVLLALGIRHVGSLMLLIFVSGLIPVVGNLVSGSVLCVMAYQARGWWGVGIFLVLTFVLHKVESYYLNPRLTARHVRLPGFVLILSLLAWEHVLGFAGLFVSFPALFVAGRIRAEMKEEEAISGRASVTPS